MKKPEFRNLSREDFAEAPWIEKLLRPLNTILGQVATGLGNGLTLGENFNAEIKTLEIQTRSEWVDLSLTAPYGSAPTKPQVRKRGARVDFRGDVLINGATGGTAFCTLPEAYRPEVRGGYMTVSGGALPLGVFVETSGAMTALWASAGTAFSLAQIAFDAATGGGVNAAFPIKFTTRVRGKVAGVIAIRVAEVVGRDERIVADAVSLPGWSQDGQTIALQSVAGLTGGKTYRVTLAILGG